MSALCVTTWRECVFTHDTPMSCIVCIHNANCTGAKCKWTRGKAHKRICSCAKRVMHICMRAQERVDVCVPSHALIRASTQREQHGVLGGVGTSMLQRHSYQARRRRQRRERGRDRELLQRASRRDEGGAGRAVGTLLAGVLEPRAVRALACSRTRSLVVPPAAAALCLAFFTHSQFRMYCNAFDLWPLSK